MLKSIQKHLIKENFIVETAQDYLHASEKINNYDYDCILLDITLPDGDGLDLLKNLKEMNKTASVIILSAKDSLEDKLTGLNLGADDYLPKPFHFAELNARINAVIRRKNFKGSNLVLCGNLILDPSERILKIEDREVVLNRKEFDILLYMVINKNRLIRKPALAEHVWGDFIDQADDFEFIYSQIKNLRKKLQENNAEVEIKAVYGVGYKLVEQ